MQKDSKVTNDQNACLIAFDRVCGYTDILLQCLCHVVYFPPVLVQIWLFPRS